MSPTRRRTDAFTCDVRWEEPSTSKLSRTRRNGWGDPGLDLPEKPEGKGRAAMGDGISQIDPEGPCSWRGLQLGSFSSFPPSRFGGLDSSGSPLDSRQFSDDVEMGSDYRPCVRRSCLLRTHGL